MALTLEIDVVWPDHRTVKVRCRGQSLLPNRDDDDPAPALFMNDVDVISIAALHAFLRRITRNAATGEVVQVGGLEPTLRAILETLDIVGPPPRPIVVGLGPA
ncbi:hypothetical protein [Actinoplanes sp. OR16]|uniref:hypothetical protein n=1 Tax=Actinoplanes sp. OR16 TaxID=946334 RepID=UPI000FD6D916|nr:hypothetical protein [Actinoplanes sp. OR16]